MTMTLRDFDPDTIWYQTEDGLAYGQTIELDPPPFTGAPDEWFSLNGETKGNHWKWDGTGEPRSWEQVKITRLTATRDIALDEILPLTKP